MGKLLQAKLGDRYNLFRNSLFKQLGSIDRERNEVVHWNVINQIGADADGNTTSVLIMVPPAYWIGDDTPERTREDLVAFSRKCGFYARLIERFGVTLAGVGREKLEEYGDEHLPIEELEKYRDEDDRWKQLFEQPIIYPPPDGHPLKERSAIWSGVNTFRIVTDNQT